jgi:hypothetical protein
MINIQDRKRKSEKLTPAEYRDLKKYVYSFPTVIDAAAAIGIHRNTLDLILIKGRCSPGILQIIREKLNRAA